MKIVIHREINGETKKIAYDAEFDIGDRVSLKIDDDPENSGIVIGIRITPNGLLYECNFAAIEGPGNYYDIELEKIK
jgi:hypothetical protein